MANAYVEAVMPSTALDGILALLLQIWRALLPGANPGFYVARINRWILVHRSV